MHGTRFDTMAICDMPLPAANEHAILLDSTRTIRFPGLSQATAHNPGPQRMRWRGGRVRGTVQPIGDSITVNLEILTNHEKPGVAANFEIDTAADSAGVVVIAAGTTKQFNWMPLTPDWRLRVVAGAGVLTDINVAMHVDWDPNPGA